MADETERRISNGEILEAIKSLKEEKEGSPCVTQKDIQSLLEVQARQSEQLKQIIDTMGKVVATLYGNGKEGLVTTVAKIAGSRAWVTIAVTAIISSSIAFVVSRSLAAVIP